MKGVVFVKFNEFIEHLWGDEFWDELLFEAKLPSEGVYTTVGLYDDQELFTLIGLVVAKKNISAKDAQIAFGKWVFKELYAAAPPQAHDFKDAFEFLHGVQSVIHIEVKKFNPDAILPEFTFLDESPTTLTFHYQSPRKLCFFCEGMVYGLAEHTHQDVLVSHKECEHNGDSRCVLEVEKI
ncbi:MAG: heme NO-binding domain-containing protein [Paraglaciecola sp.]|uniref:heme NO-binding domain-containing protein n=1 Tax=Pseudomonadati TaxID=3379134 RepID=UPI00273F1AA0|nr:heme NO-binding domain-containing protein [Paraglaciecola sp.]MDP5032657.1 heme NO-binding domain-containing protein [Paraglaciecola sp.]MDP5132448.1 heme NO-binding domain-containing protein [Paraglaciecola sp.]